MWEAFGASSQGSRLFLTRKESRMVTRNRNLRDNPFSALTADECDELRRVLSWVLAATQMNPESKATINKAIDCLEAVSPLGPEDVEQN